MGISDKETAKLVLNKPSEDWSKKSMITVRRLKTKLADEFLYIFPNWTITINGANQIELWHNCDFDADGTMSGVVYSKSDCCGECDTVIPINVRFLYEKLAFRWKAERF